MLSPTGVQQHGGTCPDGRPRRATAGLTPSGPAKAEIGLLKTFYNPATGVLAVKSADGKRTLLLLLGLDVGVTLMDSLTANSKDLGSTACPLKEMATSARSRLPGNLIPIRREDYVHPPG